MTMGKVPASSVLPEHTRTSTHEAAHLALLGTIVAQALLHRRRMRAQLVTIAPRVPHPKQSAAEDHTRTPTLARVRAAAPDITKQTAASPPVTAARPTIINQTAVGTVATRAGPHSIRTAERRRAPGYIQPRPAQLSQRTETVISVHAQE